MTARIDYDMPIADYLAIDALSSGAVGDLLESPSLYYGRHLAAKRGDTAHVLAHGTSDATERGSAFHALVLEGDEVYADRIAVWRGGPTEKGVHSTHRGTKYYKQDWEPAQREAGRTIIDADDDAVVQLMRYGVQAHPDANRLLYELPGVAEATFLFELRGMPCKARPDRTLFELDTIVELKTAASTAEKAIERQAAELGYHRKAEWYRRAYLECTGRPLREFIFVSVPSLPPYEDVVTWTSIPLAETVASLQVDRALDDLVDRLASDDWRPRRCRDIQAVGLPLWAIDDDIRNQLEGFR